MKGKTTRKKQIDFRTRFKEAQRREVPDFKFE
jgi:hypothetical protein